MKSVVGQRWTAEVAAAEFGIDRSTLSARLKQNGAIAGEDGMFSTKQIADGVYGSYEIERTRKTRYEADILEVDLAKVRNEVIDSETVFHVWENICVSIRRTILTTPLPNEQKDAILNELRTLKIEDYMEQQEFEDGTHTEDALNVHASDSA